MDIIDAHDPGQEMDVCDLGQERPEHQPRQDMRESDPGQETRERNPGQETRERDPREEMRERDPGQETLERDPGQQTRERDPREETRECDPRQETWECDLGQEIDVLDPGQEMDICDLGQERPEHQPRQDMRERHPGQEMREIDPGQKIVVCYPGQEMDVCDLGQETPEHEPRQEMRERDPGQETLEHDPGQETRKRDPGQETRKRDPGQETRKRDPRQETRRCHPGQETRERDPGQETLERDPRKETRKSDPRQETRKRDPGQETRECDPRQETLEHDPGQETLERDPRKETRKCDPGPETRERDLGQETRECDPGQETLERDPGQETRKRDSGQETGDHDRGWEVEESDTGQEIARVSASACGPVDNVLLSWDVLSTGTQSREQLALNWQQMHRASVARLKLLEDSVQPDHRSQVTVTDCEPSEWRVRTAAPLAQEELRGWLSQLTHVPQAGVGQAEAMGLQTERDLQCVMLSVNRWLERMEEALSSSSAMSVQETEAQLSYEESEVSVLTGLCCELERTRELLSAQNHSLISLYLASLHTRLQILHVTLLARCQALRVRDTHSSQLQARLRQARALLLETQDHQQLQEASGQSSAEKLQVVADLQLLLEPQEEELLVLSGEALPGSSLQQDISKLQEKLARVCVELAARREGLALDLSSGGHRERLVQGLAALRDCGYDRLAQAPSLQTNSIGHLQQHLQQHKLFFRSLENHQIWLEKITEKVPEDGLSGKEQLWSELPLLQREARQHGVRLQLLLQGWTEFETSYALLSKDLETLAASIPSVDLVEETEERLVERISLYQRMQQSLEGKRASVHQALSEGKKLLIHVSCPDLRTQVEGLEEGYRCLTIRVSHQLQHLQTLLQHWTRLWREASTLAEWLGSAQGRVQAWEQQAASVPQDLPSIHSQLRLIIEFWREVAANATLKISVVTTGEQLLRLKSVEERALRARLASCEQQWAEILNRLLGVQHQLHQLQMELVPSRQAMALLGEWQCRLAAEMAQGEERLRTASGSQSIRNLIQWHKEHEAEMKLRLLTVDSVNQSVLQVSSPDVQSDRFQRTQFAESLGALNAEWQQLTTALQQRGQQLERLLEAWSQYQNKVQSLQSWFQAQAESLSRLQRPSSHLGALTTLKHCQDLAECLKLKEMEVEKLRQAHLLLGIKGDIPNPIIEQLGVLREAHHSLEQQVQELRVNLELVLEHWRVCEEATEELDSHIVSARYSLQHCQPLTSSLQAAEAKVGTLQSVQEVLEQAEGSWNLYTTAIGSLKTRVSPSLTHILHSKLQLTHTRWASVVQDVMEELGSARALLHTWQHHSTVYQRAAAGLQSHEEACGPLLSCPAEEDSTRESLKAQLLHTQVMLDTVGSVDEDLRLLSAVAEELRLVVEASVAEALRQERDHLLLRADTLRHRLQFRASDIQERVEQLEEFRQRLQALETLIEGCEETETAPAQPGEGAGLDTMKRRMLALRLAVLDVEEMKELSYTLELSSEEAGRVHSLNRRWARVTEDAVQRCSELQASALQQESFTERCERAILLLDRMEEGLVVEIVGGYKQLQEQQKTHKLFQAEMSIAHQILDSVVEEAVRLLQGGEVEDRRVFVEMLNQLRERWAAVGLRVRQQKALVSSLVCQWRCYKTNQRQLCHVLLGMGSPLSLSRNHPSCSLRHLCARLEDTKYKERLLRRHQASYTLSQQLCSQLLPWADALTKAQLEEELRELQALWTSASTHLTEQASHLPHTQQVWRRCEDRVSELRCRLSALSRETRRPLPGAWGDLLQEINSQALQEAVWDWADGLTELQRVNEELAERVVAEDHSLLLEQVSQLQSQGEQLGQRVSLRKMELSERLELWTVFNKRSSALCEWLRHMEQKVSLNSDISIQDMINRLQKDYMEEIQLYTDNKLQIEQLGKELVDASTGSKASDIESKLQTINNHWQHLLETIEARVGRLKETLLSVRLLDTDMSNLRSWLSRIEAELSKPLVYNICDSDEIQRKLIEQQELQRDIDQHGTGVVSVLNLCDVLLHDTDACASDTESDSIQRTTRSLDRRWRNICALSVERRMKIEETWRLWQKFLDDYSHFEEWLKGAELTSAHPNSSQVLHITAREELKRFEGFQRQVHERLTQLELINKQYRRLARENRIDCASKLRYMVHEGNQRWDSLQRRVAAILRRLKHFTSQREEFEGWREGLLVWLTEMDLQLTNIEHFSESDRDDKMRQLNAFQQEITLYTNKIDQLIVFGEQLIQKSEPGDAVLIEDELEELHAYCQEVFGRVARFHQRLMSRRSVCDDERELSDREMEMESQDSETQGEASDGDSLPLVLGGPGQRLEVSGCGTPVSVDSIPLEWDHTVDVGGSSSHEEEDDNDYFSGLSDMQITETPEAYVKMTESTLRTPAVNSGLSPGRWEPSSQSEGTRCQAQQSEITLSYPTGQAFDTRCNKGYVRLLSECSGSINSLRRVSDILQDEETSQPPGLVHLSNLEKPAPGVIERWELLHAQAVSKQLRVKHDLQQWQQLNSDLQDITAWLAEIQPHLTLATDLEPATNIHTIEEKIRRLRDLQKAFDNYKAIIISVNLSSRDFLHIESPEARALHQRLHNLNHTWNSTSQSLEANKLSLQTALLACQDFHLTTHRLLVWLAGAEARRGAVCVTDPSLDSHTLAQQRHDLMSLERELLERQVQAKSLQDMASQLLVTTEGEDCVQAKEKVHVISNKLKLLVREVAEDLHNINLQLDSDPGSAVSELDFLDGPSQPPKTSTPLQPATGRRRRMEETESRGRSRELPGAARSLLARVLRAAFPLQLCILLLLLLSCLLPLAEDDYSCALANNFARSFYPMLRYTNGPPPT